GPRQRRRVKECEERADIQAAGRAWPAAAQVRRTAARPRSKESPMRIAGGRRGSLPVRVSMLMLLALTSREPSSAFAQDDPFAMWREEQTVTGSAKRPQPLSETPSSVTVITAEEIRTRGYHSLGDALRWVRGVFVNYDRNYTYVAVRGLLRPGDYNNKVLLTIDGHALNGNVFGDGLFGPELGLDMETVERIEVVRGPGSALYGSSAVLAVVNVVTRR